MRVSISTYSSQAALASASFRIMSVPMTLRLRRIFSRWYFWSSRLVFMDRRFLCENLNVIREGRWRRRGGEARRGRLWRDDVETWQVAEWTRRLSKRSRNGRRTCGPGGMACRARDIVPQRRGGRDGAREVGGEDVGFCTRLLSSGGQRAVSVTAEIGVSKLASVRLGRILGPRGGRLLAIGATRRLSGERDDRILACSGPSGAIPAS